MLGFEYVLLARISLCITLLNAQKLGVNADAKVRVCLKQRFFTGPLVAFINREDDAEALIVFNRAFKNLLQLDLVQVARAGDIMSTIKRPRSQRALQWPESIDKIQTAVA